MWKSKRALDNAPAVKQRADKVDIARAREDDDGKLVRADDGEELARRVWHKLEDWKVDYGRPECL